MKHALLASCGLSALLLGLPAQAQSLAAAPSPAVATGKLETIVVTAQKVRTNVQRTPVAIQTISGRTLAAAGVETAKDLNRLVPGLSVQVAGAGGSSFYIRGVGNVNDLGTNDNGIAVSIDQAYFSRGIGPDLVLYDMDRIEVQKGPQGTLYGRNATGGTINFVSTKPVLKVFNGYGGIEIGNYGELRVNGAVNLPISDTVAARVAFQTEQHDGYLSDGYEDLDNKEVRGHLLWKPTSDLSVLLSAEFDHGGGKGPEAVPVPDPSQQYPYGNPIGSDPNGPPTFNVTRFPTGFVSSNPWAGGGNDPAIRAIVAATAPVFGNTGTVPFGQYIIPPGSCFPGCIPQKLIQQQPGPFQVQNNGTLDNSLLSLRGDVELNLGFATLSVLPALLNTNYNDIFVNGPQAFFNAGAARQLSLETRLASPTDRQLTWIGGLFYQQEHQAYRFVMPSPPNAYSETNEPDMRDQTGGVFAQGTFKILPDLSFTAGARYSFEDKVSYNADGATAAPFGGPPDQASFAVAAVNKERASAPTYRVGLQWQVSAANLLYVSYATGFHSGGLQPGNPPTRPLCQPNPTLPPDQLLAAFTGCDTTSSYLPEYLDAIAIGSKNRFFDDRVQVNLEAYDWEYKDLQVGSIGVINPSITGPRIVNAGRATIRGVDIDTAFAITPDDRLTAVINYNKSEYGNFQYYLVVYNVFAFVIDESHQPFVNAPVLTGTLNYEHNFRFASGATLTPSVTAQYTSSVILAYGPLYRQAGYVKFDLGLDYRTGSGAYEARLFVRNLTNEATLNNANNQDPSTGLPYGNLAAPRTFGGSLTVHF